jgi:flagellar hook-associated protein 1 FlgK
MANPLGIGYSALESLQKAISITGNNIANVNTEGYSRQIASFDEQPGYGVKISSVERNYDFYLSREVQERTAGQFAATTTSDLASRLNTLLTGPATSAAGVLDNFFSAVQDVANNPSTLPERQVLLGEAQTLTDRFQFIDGRIEALSSEINLRMGTVVAEINGLSANIATLNNKIATSLQRTGQAAPDLLDERDRNLAGLSKLVGYNIRENEDGSFDVTMGGGQPLVSQFTAESLTTFVSTTNPKAMAVAGRTAGADISSSITGGELGGLIDFRGQQSRPGAGSVRACRHNTQRELQCAAGAGSRSEWRGGRRVFYEHHARSHGGISQYRQRCHYGHDRGRECTNRGSLRACLRRSKLGVKKPHNISESGN